MRGFLWTAGVWAVTIMLLVPRGRTGALRRWIHFLDREKLALLLVLLGTHTIAKVTTAEEVAADPLIIDRIMRGALAVLALAVIVPVLTKRARTVSNWSFPGMTGVTLYGVVAALSTVYSVFPLGTAGKVVELGAGIAVVWAVALRQDAQSGLRSLVRFVVILEAALVIGASVGFFILPAVFAVPTRRPGFLFSATMMSPWAHSNALSAGGGLVAAYSLAMVLSLEDRKLRLRWGSVFLASSFGIVLASGRQGVLIWLAGVAILLWLLRRRLFLLVAVPATAGIAGLYWDVLWPVLTRGDGPRNIASLTGRTGFWEAAYTAWLRHPWTGFGFGSGGRFVALQSIGKDTISSLHSGYFETLIGVGLLGLIPLVYAIFWVIKWSISNLRNRRDVCLAILVVPLLMHAAVANGFAAWLKEDTIVFMALVALADVSRTYVAVDRRTGSLGESTGSASELGGPSTPIGQVLA